jgi:tetratricopeptide (TPR) repeat protein
MRRITFGDARICAAAGLCAAVIACLATGVTAAESSGTAAREPAGLLGPVPAPKIKVTRATPESGPSPALRAAYAALIAGDYNSASRLYEQLAQSDPRNIDVLLGQAAVALHRVDTDAARNHYMAVLRLEPTNAVAQGALLALFGRADYATAELRLNELASREPVAFLYQALGTLYAEQGLWPQAQHAYFQAHRLDGRNADHAYNLAVSLEHIGQRGQAAVYYRRAVELASARPTSAFDVAVAQDRAARLTAALSD